MPQPARDEPPLLRLAAFLHDIGKPATFADGHFVGHETVGASLAEAWLTELHAPRFLTMDTATWSATTCSPTTPAGPMPRCAASSGAVARRRSRTCSTCGPPTTSGVGSPADANDLESLRARCHAQLEARVALDLPDLAVNGSDLMQALDIAAGPAVGSLLDHLLELVMVDPMLDDRSLLLARARELVAAGQAWRAA